jgi:hypothetical protein
MVKAERSLIMAIWVNREFGPAWRVQRPGDADVQGAHRIEDAEAYERGEISAEELVARNLKGESE